MRALVITASILLTLAVVIFWLSTRPVKAEPWDLITSDAWLVIETDHPQQLLDKVKASGILSAKALSKFPFLNRLPKWVGNKKLLIAAYRISPGKHEVTFVVPSYGSALYDSITKGASVKTRIFSGANISDITVQKETYSACSMDDYLLVGSAISIEGVIRARYEGSKALFKERSSELFKMASLKGDDGNVYIKPIYQTSRKKSSSQWPDWPDGIVYDFKANSSQVLFNGFAFDSLSKSSLLTLYRDQKPGALTLATMIPSDVEWASQHYISNFPKWSSRKAALAKANDAKVSTPEPFNSKFFGNELELAFYSVSVRDTIDKAIIIKSAKPFDTSALRSVTDTSFNDSYAGYSIAQFNASVKPENAFWPITSHTHFRYYFVLDGRLVWAETLRSAKSLIDRIQNEQTVSKSLAWSTFLSSIAQEANVTLFGTRAVLDHFAALESLPLATSQVEQFAVNFSNLGENFYSACLIKLNKPSVQERKVEANLQLLASASGAPQLVINHTTNENEIFLQDSLKNVYLIAKGKILWQSSLGEFIEGQAHQVDYLKNDKLQYIFATKESLQLVDRLGRPVTGFPKKFAGKKFQRLSVVDYDQSRNYRFLLREQGKNIFLIDDKGGLLEGWSPKTFTDLVVDEGHHRLFGKDYIYVLTASGSFHLHNRRGEAVAGFPVMLGLRKCQGAILVEGREKTKTYFAVVDEAGQLVHISLEGKVLKKEPLIKTSAQSKFYLVRDSKSQSAVIARVDKTRIAFFNLNGEAIYDIENPFSENVEFAYFHGDAPLTAILDRTQRYLVLLREGKIIHGQPLEATVLPAVEMMPNSSLRISFANGKQLVELSL